VSESKLQAEVRLALAHEQAGLLMRNNSGALKDERGRLIRFGLGNDSAAVNKVMKSSDLIGIRRVVIGPQDVGKVVGQFMAIECKDPGWRGAAGSERARAQENWMSVVRTWGGVAGFANSVEMARNIWESDV